MVWCVGVFVLAMAGLVTSFTCAMSWASKPRDLGPAIAAPTVVTTGVVPEVKSETVE